MQPRRVKMHVNTGSYILLHFTSCRRPGRVIAGAAPCGRRDRGARPGGAFAKCLLNFGLRPDMPAGIRHRQPMGDRQLRTVACDVAQRRSAL